MTPNKHVMFGLFGSVRFGSVLFWFGRVCTKHAGADGLGQISARTAMRMCAYSKGKAWYSD
eukprot:12967039-Alexandrium_andersonii.AAC.1